MADAEPEWETSDEETDAHNAEDLANQPEAEEDYVVVDIHAPALLNDPRNLRRCTKDLRNNFNVNEVIERPPNSAMDSVIRVEGYSLDEDDVLRLVQQYDRSARIV